jgi:hypothetical protein
MEMGGMMFVDDEAGFHMEFIIPWLKSEIRNKFKGDFREAPNNPTN